MYRIITNKIRCKFCGDVIQSISRHDFRRCTCGKCFVDGGTDYIRRGFSTENPEDCFADLSTYQDIETGKIIIGKDVDQSQIPIDNPETPEELGKAAPEIFKTVLNEMPKDATPKEIMKEYDIRINAHDIPEMNEADEAEPLKEEVIVKRDTNSKPIAGRYPFGKK